MDKSRRSELDSIKSEIGSILDIATGLRFGVPGKKILPSYEDGATHLRNTSKKAEEMLQKLIDDVEDEEVVRACLKLHSACELAGVHASTEWMDTIDQATWMYFKLQLEEISTSLVKLRSDNQKKTLRLWIIRCSAAAGALGMFTFMVFFNDPANPWFNTLAALPTSSLWKAFDESIVRRLDETAGLDKAISTLSRIASIIINCHRDLIGTYHSAEFRIDIPEDHCVPRSRIRSWFARLSGSAAE